MKGKVILSAILGFGAFSLSHIASATWDEGPCPQPHIGPSPCIEAIFDGVAYHFNGSGGHNGHWHGSPVGGDLVFTGPSVLGCSGLNLNCSLTLRGQVQKCVDSNGDPRIGVRVTSSSVSGAFPCGTVSLSNFPWVVNEDVLPHCPFGQACDDFIPYTPGATSYTGVAGLINISVLGINRVTNGHVHNVIFTPGVGASFTFNSAFYDCNENPLGCNVNGTLRLNNNNGDAINVY